MPELSREEFEKWANAKGTMGNSWNGQHYENVLHETAWQAAKFFYAAAFGEALRWNKEEIARRIAEFAAGDTAMSSSEALAIINDVLESEEYLSAEQILQDTHEITLAAAPDSRPSTEQKID